MTTCPHCKTIVRVENGKLERHNMRLPNGYMFRCIYSDVPIQYVGGAEPEADELPDWWSEERASA